MQDGMQTENRVPASENSDIGMQSSDHSNEIAVCLGSTK
jgi:hypothetical protein